MLTRAVLITLMAFMSLIQAIEANDDVLTIEKAAQLMRLEGLQDSHPIVKISQDLLYRGKRRDAPRYILSRRKPIMQMVVINRTSLVSQQLLKKTLRVVKQQVRKDFSHYYGILVKFNTIKESQMGKIPWGKYVPLIVTDFLLVDLPGTIAFHSVQDSAGINGAPIGALIPQAPNLPNGIPYIVIPMGSGTDYGVVPASQSGSPYLPPTFDTIFSNAVSHEVLETLGNYALNTYFSDFMGNPLTNIDFYWSEICDPVEFTPGYIKHNFYISNFVLPSWFVPNLTKGPFDFLNTVPAPLTPFSGEITLIRASAAGVETLDKISPPNDPTNIIYTTPEIIFPASPAKFRIRGYRNAAALKRPVEEAA